MRHLGVMMCLALAVSCSSGATRHRHNTRSVQDAPDYRDETDAVEDSQLYQRRVTSDEEDPIAASNIRKVFSTNKAPQRIRPSGWAQARRGSDSWASRSGTRTVVRRPVQQQRAQQPCAQAPATQPYPAFYPPPMPSYGGYPTLPWWPSLGGFHGFPVIFVPVPVCNCSAQGEKSNVNIDTRGKLDDVDYEELGPLPLDLTPATTSRPLPFKSPKVDHTPSDYDEKQEEVPSSPGKLPTDVESPPASNGGPTAKRPGPPRCARAIVNCCELELDVKCLEKFGCPGAFFQDPCEYYDNAFKILTKYYSNKSK